MRAVSKPDVSQVGWIVRERARGEAPSAGIAEAMHVDVRTVQRLWARFRHTRPGDIECPARTGGPQDGLPGRRGHGAVAGLCAQCRAGASGMGGGGAPGASRACAYPTTKYAASWGKTGWPRRSPKNQANAGGSAGNAAILT